MWRRNHRRARQSIGFDYRQPTPLGHSDRPKLWQATKRNRLTENHKCAGMRKHKSGKLEHFKLLKLGTNL
jgi:hypothetical protein